MNQKQIAKQRTKHGFFQFSVNFGDYNVLRVQMNEYNGSLGREKLVCWVKIERQESSKPILDR